MDPRLEIVRLAYQEHGCLHFQVFVNRPKAAKIARIIGHYNEFDPYKVIRFLRLLPPKTRLEIGREYSPVLYVYAKRGFFVPGEKRAIKKAANSADLRCDEYDLEESRIHVRIWWD